MAAINEITEEKKPEEAEFAKEKQIYRPKRADAGKTHKKYIPETFTAKDVTTISNGDSVVKSVGNNSIVKATAKNTNNASLVLALMALGISGVLLAIIFKPYFLNNKEGDFNGGN
jgi:hypothetical protein